MTIAPTRVNNAAYRSALRTKIGYPEWLTFAAFLVLSTLFAGSILLAISGAIPLWLGTVLSFVSIHAGFTIMHEASHRTISGGDKKRLWMDGVPGTIHAAMLLYDYPIFRDLHMNHHNQTGDENADPDNWLQKHNTAVVMLLSPFVALHYLKLYVLLAWQRGTLLSAPFLFSIFRVIALVTAILTLLWVSPVNTFMLWVLPASTASILLSLSHRMLHTDEAPTAPGTKARIIVGRGVWEWIICPFFWLNNHHALHHENPRLPVGQHASFFKQFEDIFRADGVEVVTLGDRTQTNVKTAR